MRRKLLSLLILALLPLMASADAVKIGGIYYNLDAEKQTAEVTNPDENSGDEYSGDITIPESVTYDGVEYNVKGIAEGAFLACSSLTSVIIPNSVTSSVGQYTFYGCSGLTSVIIGNGVTSIGDNAFYHCTGLTSITIGTGVTSVGKDAFAECNSLTSVVISDIGAWCNISSDGSPTSNPLYYARHLFLNDEEIKGEFTIPQTVTTIADRDGFSFGFNYCSELTSVTIPNSVTYIGYSAFSDCSNLTTVILPRKTPVMGCPFSDCNLKEVYSKSSNPKAISEDVFLDGNGTMFDATLYVPVGSKAKYEATDGWNKFTNIVEVEGLSGDVIDFEDENVEAICLEKWDTNGDGDLSMDEAAAVTDLGNAFYSKNITSFNELQYFTGLTAIGEMAFHFSNITSVKFPTSLLEIGNGAFDETAIESIDGGVTKNDFVFPNHITTLRGEAFAVNDGIHSVTIPASVTLMEPMCFRQCPNLTSFTIDEANPVYKMVDGWVIENGTKMLFSPVIQTIESLVVPEGITEIARRAGSYYGGVSGVKTVMLPASLKKIGYSAFYNLTKVVSNSTEPAELEVLKVEDRTFYPFDDATFTEATLYVPAGSKDKYLAAEGWKQFANIMEMGPEPYAVLSDDGTTLTFYYDDKKGSRGGIDINNSNISAVSSSSSPYGTATTAIFDTSFANYKPTSTAYWFQNCRSLTSITGMENLKTDDVTSMEEMFLGCSSLTSLDLSNFNTANVTNMGGMFTGCSLLTSLDVSGFNTNKVTNMGKMFYICSSLTSLDVSGFNTENVTNMDLLFSGCPSLTSLDVSGFNTAKVTSMVFMFGSCSSLTNLDLSGFNTENVTNMYGMFNSCSSLQTIYCSDTWSCDESTEMFYYCLSLKGAISYDSEKTDVTYANPTTGYFTAKGTGYEVGDVFTVDGMTFMVTSLDPLEVRVGKGELNGIGVSPAIDTSTEGTVKIPSSVTGEDGNNYAVTTIGAGAFSDCSNVTSVAIPNSVTAISGGMDWGDFFNGGAFENCGLTSLVIPASVTSIGSGAFAGCGKLKSIVVEEGNTKYDSRDNCNAIIRTEDNLLIAGCEKTVVPDGVTGIGACTFKNCSGLASLVLPGSLTSIGQQAFEGCSGLTSVVIPEGVTCIWQGTFNGCSSLTTMTIPKGMKWIGRDTSSGNFWSTFGGCESLTDVYCYAEEVPEVTAYVFKESNIANATLYVPTGCKDAYAEAEGWKDFKEIVEKEAPYNLCPDDHHPHMIDLGLPSGTKWSCCNVGADKPEEFGGLYAWGETEEKNYYDWSTYKYVNSNGCISDDLGNDISGTIYDVATVKWGNGWRMPTKEEFEELLTYCTSSWTCLQQNNVTGIKFISNNGNSIFLPAAGDVWESTKDGTGVHCHYHSSTIAEERNTVWNMMVTESFSDWSRDSGCYGSSVRAVASSSSDDEDVITFADEKVKAICVENWDSNGDGKLSYEEAAAVTDLGEVFEGNREITSFNELKYFTGLTKISEAAFFGDYALKSVELPAGLTSIEHAAFGICSSLSSIFIPKNVTTINGTSFRDCTSLVEITVDGENPVYESPRGCNAIINKNTKTLVTGCKVTVVPDGVEIIGPSAFYGQYSIKELVLPASVKQIGYGSYDGCGFETLVIPNTVEFIDFAAFWNCHSLATIKLPEKTPTLSSEICSNCKKLTEIISLNPNPTAISDDVFIVDFDGTMPNAALYVPVGSKAKYEATDGWKKFAQIVEAAIEEEVIYIPNEEEKTVAVDTSDKSATEVEIFAEVKIDGEKYEVTAIGEGAFENNENLEKVSIPETVESIGDNAFAGCSNLKEIRVYAEEPIKLGSSTAAGTRGEGASTVFAEVDMETCVLYVPAGSKEKYEQAEGWKEFTHIVEMGEILEITIGKNGKTTFCGDKGLDFSGTDKVKAFIATGFDKTEGIIWMTRVKDVPAQVPVMIKGTAEKTYKVPVTAGGTSYYENMFKGNTTGETITINETSDDGTLTNYYMSGGQFVSVSKSAKIGNNKCYLQLPTNFETETTGEALSVKIADSGKSSFAAPYDLDFTDLGDDLKAFTATGYDASTTTVWLTRVKKVQKGEGLMLKGKGGVTYTIPSTGVQAAYENMIVGNTGEGITIYETSDDGKLTNYYLKGGTYMKVSGNANIGKNKSYLQLPTYMLAGARSEDAADLQSEYSFAELETESMPIIFASIGGDDDETTGIRTTDCTDDTDESRAAWYTLGGQRISKPTKPGLYIRNGRKVVIRSTTK